MCVGVCVGVRVCRCVCVCVTKVVYACERQGQPHDTACSVSPVGGDWDTAALCMCVCACARVHLIDHPVGTETGGGGESSVEHTLKDLPENATVDQLQDATVRCAQRGWGRRGCG